MSVFRKWLSCILLTSSLAFAQSPAGSDWHRVELLHPHTRIYVATDHGTHTCAFQSAGQDNLTCVNGHTYLRGEIKTIKLSQRLDSTLIGTAIGFGGGAIAGGVVAREQKGCSDSFNFCEPGWQTALAGAIVGAVPGAITGYFTDFSKGPVVYRRP